jgi:predicted metal-dependent hydrolase
MKIDEIIRSKRKTFTLEIKPDGRLIVRVPKQATNKQIQAIVEAKTDWINQTRARVAKKFPDQKPISFQPGDKFWYLGEKYPLRFTNRQRPPLELNGGFLLSRNAKERAKEVFIEWYREETRAITHRLIERYSKQYKFEVNQVRINSARTRWGSCSGKNNLNFTYRLCMAPLAVVEYVVVHELAHLKVHNHSRDFWNLVAEIKPDYKQDRQWLKKFGYLLTLD